MNKYPKRKPTRLKEYDYTQPGYYYVTICTHNRNCILGKIIDNDVQLNDAGEMVDQILRTLPEYYSDIIIDNYVVMPNHVHAIIIIKEPVGAAPRGRPLINIRIDDGQPASTLDGRASTSDGPAQGPAPTKQLSLSEIMYCFKSLTTKRYIDGVKNNAWLPYDKHLWQKSFYDHIIRTDT